MEVHTTAIKHHFQNKSDENFPSKSMLLGAIHSAGFKHS